MPAISPWNESPRRSEITEANASPIEEAIGPANFTQASNVPSTQPARVKACGSPAGGANSQALSSHRFASLMALRTAAPSSALTLVREPSAFACCNASVFASFTLMGPSCTVCCISFTVLSPPAVNMLISCCTSAGLGSVLGS